MAKITNIHAREILDSRGTPTLEVDVTLSTGIIGRAAVPSGASTGAHEACELRDGDKARYMGKGVLKAIENVNKQLKESVVGLNVFDQKTLDNTMIKLDGTDNKSKLGANAILGVSMAAAKAAALETRTPLYKYVGGVKAYKLPVPLMNVLNGGAHANNGLDVQEFMIVPNVGGTFKRSLQAGSEIFHNLKSILNQKGFSTAVGDEGGFAPKLTSNQDAMELLMLAIEKAGYKAGKEIHIALDVAATELFKDGKYTWEGQQITGDELSSIYQSWSKKYPLISVEDGFSEDDWASWINYTKVTQNKMQVVGDDLFVTNTKRLAQGIEQAAANALLVKVNQIGTLTETFEAVTLAQRNKFKTVMSHRSGETEDSIIADLAVALDCSQIKTGSLCRSDRVAKYNQLLRIEEQLGQQSQYWGLDAFNCFN